MPSKCLLIVLDGLGDRAYADLGHRTPLQAARTPLLDELASRGANGLYHAASLGVALPSENAHFAMFGYDMAEFPGRGALEALGAGIPFGPKDVAILAHFVSVRIDDRVAVLEAIRPGTTEEEASSAFEAIGIFRSDDVDFRLHRTYGVDGVLTLSGDVSPFITDSDTMQTGRPLIAVKPWETCTGEPSAERTARALQAYLRWAHLSLEKHPLNAERFRRKVPRLNFLVTQRAGRLRAVAPFPQRYGMRSLSVASGIVYHGLSTYVGMDVLKVKDTGDPGGDLAGRIRLAGDALKDYDFIHVHTKTPDEAAHTKNPAGKKEVIEALDAGMAKELPRLLEDPEVLLVVTSDHSTPSSGPLIHSGEPIPLLLHGGGVWRDAVRAFDEVSAAGGALGCVRGKELIYLVLNHLDRAKLGGIMDTPVDQPFWPGDYEPFRME